MAARHQSNNADIVSLLLDFREAWAKRDVDRILSCFHPEGSYFASVGPVPGERAVGAVAVRELVTRMLSTDLVVDQSTSFPLVVGESAFWSWDYRLASGETLLGCDLFEFRDGLIFLKDAYRKTLPTSAQKDSSE